MAYGTALASFNVEEFGTERVSASAARRSPRGCEELREITQFEAAPRRLARRSAVAR